ncbi:UNVERIFIED_ORG: AcrR family transcriptional regulator [Burkholderia territorii]
MNGYLLPSVNADVGTGLPQIAGTRFVRVFDELRHNFRTADELTLFLLLGMTTFACQDGAFVRLRNGTLSPLTGYFIVSAPPASGKSTVLTRLSQPFGQAEIEAKEGGAQLRRHYRAKRVVWRSQVRQLTREIDEAIAAGEDPGYLSARLSALLPGEPQPPRTASWLAEDATIQALRRRLHTTWPSAGIVLDEGVRFLTSKLSNAFADFCTLHDARLAKNERISTGTESIPQAFLSMVIATQPGPLFEYLHRHGANAFKTGFLSRVQLLDVPSRSPMVAPSGHTLEKAALEEYDDRVVSLARDARKRMRSDGTFDPIVLEFSEAAGRMLDSMPHMIRARLWSAGQLPEMEPYLLRLPVLMTRIAGVLHRFEGDDGLISDATMRVAAELGFWLAQETSRVISRSKEPSAADKQDIDILVHMLRVHVLRYRRPFVARRELSDMAPGFGLDEARCKRALHALCQAHWVSLDSRGSAKFIRLSPQYFPGC